MNNIGTSFVEIKVATPRGYLSGEKFGSPGNKSLALHEALKEIVRLIALNGEDVEATINAAFDQARSVQPAHVASAHLKGPADSVPKVVEVRFMRSTKLDLVPKSAKHAIEYVWHTADVLSVGERVIVVKFTDGPWCGGIYSIELATRDVDWRVVK